MGGDVAPFEAPPLRHASKVAAGPTPTTARQADERARDHGAGAGGSLPGNARRGFLGMSMAERGGGAVTRWLTVSPAFCQLRELVIGWPAVILFQAEDGIRDGHVTGVQTCALPI